MSRPAVAWTAGLATRPAVTALALGLAVALLACRPAHAQLGLPRPDLPGLPDLPTAPVDLPKTIDRSTQTLNRAGETLRLQQLRRRGIADLLRRHGAQIEADPAGEPMIRNQIVAYSPSEQTMAAARHAGFSIVGEQTLATLDLRLVILRQPERMTTAAALERLRAIDPGTVFDFNHVYLASGAADDDAISIAQSNRADTGHTHAISHPPKIGLIDGGIDPQAVALRAVSVQRWGCDHQSVPSPHGTAIASLMVGKAGKFRGAAPGAQLFAADIYCGQPTGGAVAAMASAFAWLAQERVPVINISLVGPPNRILERMVQSMITRGHIVVAAVGNDGPAAPPLYPAAYPDVVGVTGVDARQRILPEAGRGAQVAFAAPGADMAAASRSGYVIVRGTSFAAPIVAGLLAASLSQPDPIQARHAVANLAETAADLGERGKDPVYGHGLVGKQVRTPPERVRATPAPSNNL